MKIVPITGHVCWEKSSKKERILLKEMMDTRQKRMKVVITGGPVYILRLLSKYGREGPGSIPYK